MKTEELLMSGTSEERKIPYVLLERCSLEEINSYMSREERNSDYETDSNSEQLQSREERNSDYETDSNSEQLQPREERNSDYEFDSNLERRHSNSLNLLLIADRQRLFHSYVLLERLSPNVIQNLLSKKEE